MQRPPHRACRRRQSPACRPVSDRHVSRWSHRKRRNRHERWLSDAELRDVAPIAASRRPGSGRLDPACRRDNRGRNSWHFALPTAAGKRDAALVDVGRVETAFTREGGDQPVVGSHVFEHAGQKSWFARGGANLGWADAGDGEKAPEPFAIARDERKSLNRKPFCLLSCERNGLASSGKFAFP